MINTVEAMQNLIQFGIIGETTDKAPAVQQTPRGTDDHRERMNAMASIAVPLHSRKYPDLVAYVDEQDYDLVSQYRWNAQPGRNTFYAIASVRLRGMGRAVQIKMHRMILDPDSSLVVDHIDGNGLNNTRSNLLTGTHADNLDAPNVKSHRGSTSRFRGVHLQKSRGKWTAHYKGSYLGIFDTEEDAAIAYDSARFSATSDIRHLNFPGNVEAVEEMSKGVFDE